MPVFMAVLDEDDTILFISDNVAELLKKIEEADFYTPEELTFYRAEKGVYTPPAQPATVIFTGK